MWMMIARWGFPFDAALCLEIPKGFVGCLFFVERYFQAYTQVMAWEDCCGNLLEIC